MRLLYFAWLRERLNTGAEEVFPPETVRTVDDLIDWLSARSEAAALAFARRDLIRAAVDKVLAGPDHPVIGAREIALFPPMTGG